MKKLQYKFTNKATDYYFDADFARLQKLVDINNAVLITDENIFNHHTKKFKGWNTIVLKPGEEYKVQATADTIIEQLIQFKADRKTFLVGIGGGVITDLTGYVASIYMRGLRFGFVPTSILAMVDASIGGKNGIDVGVYKNLVGTIRQPDFLLYDLTLLRSLPKQEWINGFAEIIKHACIKDAALFKELEKNNIGFYKKDKVALSKLIRRNANIKSIIVQNDEFESGDRKLLNFGHTMGHAIENMYELSHGQAISIGMVVACQLSQQLCDFNGTIRVMRVLEQYGLPTLAEYDKDKAFAVLRMDKKRENDTISYVLLEKIGQGIVKNIPLEEVKRLLEVYN